MISGFYLHPNPKSWDEIRVLPTPTGYPITNLPSRPPTFRGRWLCRPVTSGRCPLPHLVRSARRLLHFLGLNILAGLAADLVQFRAKAGLTLSLSLKPECPPTEMLWDIFGCLYFGTGLLCSLNGENGCGSPLYKVKWWRNEQDYYYY